MRGLCAVLVLAGAGCFAEQSRDCSPERCNNWDDDCDGLIDEDFALGEACDGADRDLCEDGVTICRIDSQGTTCDDDTDEHPDLCNGVSDEDCDPTSPDGSGEVSYGTPCDGPDSDSCPEGSTICVDQQLVCNDATGDSVELCNSVDDDCNGTADDGYDLTGDIANCGACGNVCTNAHGTTACVASVCEFTCASGARDCNGDPTDGCEALHDANPTCADAIDLGTLVGDELPEFVEHSGTGEERLLVYVLEVSSSNRPTTAVVELASPAGMNFDLYVACGGSCGGALMGSSTEGEGVVDSVPFRNDDTSDSDDSRPLYIEVRYVSGDVCGSWTLTVTGGVTVPAATCN